MPEAKAIAIRRSFTVLLAVCVQALCGCHTPHQSERPSIAITIIPEAAAGGPDTTMYIGGTVSNAKPGQKVVLYAHSGVWWVQPLVAHPLTEVQPDSTWKNLTHLGTEYAALLVEPGFQPPARLNSLPAAGQSIVSVAIVAGRPGKPVIAKTLHFSDYDWVVRSASSDRGGEPNAYDPDNAWVDRRGYLHLYMGLRQGRWTCSEVHLDHSLGYGTYRFTVQNVSQLSPSAVLGLFTYDDVRSQNAHNELDVEISRWANPASWNAQYVVQPFYVAENVSRFVAPPGLLTYSFRWEPGTAAFQTTSGPANGSASSNHLVSQHTFTADVPGPASETVHMNLYDFHHSRQPDKPPAEVVIEKFEYIP